MVAEWPWAKIAQNYRELFISTLKKLNRFWKIKKTKVVGFQNSRIYRLNKFEHIGLELHEVFIRIIKAYTFYRLLMTILNFGP